MPSEQNFSMSRVCLLWAVFQHVKSMFTNKIHVGKKVALELAYVSVLVLTHLPQVREK